MAAGAPSVPHRVLTFTSCPRPWSVRRVVALMRSCGPQSILRNATDVFQVLSYRRPCFGFCSSFLSSSQQGSLVASWNNITNALFGKDSYLLSVFLSHCPFVSSSVSLLCFFLVLLLTVEVDGSVSSSILQASYENTMNLTWTFNVSFSGSVR